MDSPVILLPQSVSTLRRVVIARVEPEIDGGRFPIKRTIRERVQVRADIFADGHDKLGALLLYRASNESAWREEEMRLVENDRWEAQFRVASLGRYQYTILGWVDAFATWRGGLEKNFAAGLDVAIDIAIGADLVQAAADRAPGTDAQKLEEFARKLKKLAAVDAGGAVKVALSSELGLLMKRNRDENGATRYEKELEVVVDPEKARFSTWYEMFPRSCTTDASRHGTFRDCLERLPYVAGMGFDVLYLSPIHPIGRTERKGKNNALTAIPGDPGSPWAIGGEEGGHKAIHPELGTLADLKELQRRAHELGMDLALDLAYQCSPDHPYVREHREWFRTRPDGSVQYAENPPKKYQDIYPFDFDSEHATELWEELKSVVAYWAEQGIRIFRVDNPHTKPFDFWEWLINGIKQEYPDAIFLSEAFTRPAVMYQLAKLGFTQSYTYYAWKNTNSELTEYFTEIAQTNVREFFRANVWPNTPDILNAFLQNGGRPAFMSRLILAATLGANYGIYGPAFELSEHLPMQPGSEEYLHSEKYEIRVWDLANPNSLKNLITSVNGIRRAHPALQSDWSLKFHPTDNEQLIAYSKVSKDAADMLLMVANLDPHNVQSGWVSVALKEFGMGAGDAYEVQDLLTDAKYVWRGSRNFVQLNPSTLPAHIFYVRPIG